MAKSRLTRASRSTALPVKQAHAGNRKSSKLRKGAPWLKTTLVQRAESASNRKDSYFRAQFLRLRSRRGSPKAFCAVAASLLTAIYAQGRHEVPDLGNDHFDKRQTKAKATASSPMRRAGLSSPVSGPSRTPPDANLHGATRFLPRTAT